MKIALALAVILAGILPRTTLAQELRFHSAVDGFSFDLPAGWVQVPHEQIEARVAAIRAAAPNSRSSVPSYAFQEGNVGNWFAHPYLLVVVGKSGPAPKGHLERIATTKAVGVNDRISRELSSFLSDFHHGQPIFDRKTGYMWLHTRSNLAGRGVISGVMAVVPTSYGEIQIQSYVAEQDLSAFVPKFGRLVETLTLDESAQPNQEP